MFNLKKISISMGLVTFINWFGNTQTGGDGFFPDESQAPVGFTSENLIFSLILGAFIGLIPWRKIFNLVRKIFK